MSREFEFPAERLIASAPPKYGRKAWKTNVLLTAAVAIVLIVVGLAAKLVLPTAIGLVLAVVAVAGVIWLAVTADRSTGSAR